MGGSDIEDRETETFCMTQGSELHKANVEWEGIGAGHNGNHWWDLDRREAEVFRSLQRSRVYMRGSVS